MRAHRHRSCETCSPRDQLPPSHDSGTACAHRHRHALSQDLIKPKGACVYGEHTQLIWYFGMPPPAEHPVYLAIDEDNARMYEESVDFFDTVMQGDPEGKYSSMCGTLERFGSARTFVDRREFHGVEHPSPTDDPSPGTLNAFILDDVLKYRAFVQNPLASVYHWFYGQSSMPGSKNKGALLPGAWSYEVDCNVNGPIAHRVESLPRIIASLDRTHLRYTPPLRGDGAVAGASIPDGRALQELASRPWRCNSCKAVFASSARKAIHRHCEKASHTRDSVSPGRPLTANEIASLSKGEREALADEWLCACCGREVAGDKMVGCCGKGGTCGVWVLLSCSGLRDEEDDWFCSHCTAP